MKLVQVYLSEKQVKSLLDYKNKNFGEYSKLSYVVKRILETAGALGK